MQKDMLDLLLYWINERRSIYIKRALGNKPPFTDDPILQQYKFTNVNRELDRTSIWVAENIRAKYYNDPDCWFALAVAVFINKAETLAALCPLLPYDEQRMLDICRNRMARGEQVYSGAYIIRSYSNVDRAEYIFSKVLRDIWIDRERLQPLQYPTLSAWWDELTTYHGMGSFLAAQTIASAKYLPGWKDHFPDWVSFAKSGPGSRRGMNRVFGLPVDCPWDEGMWYSKLKELWSVVNTQISDQLHFQDLQNCLCEFDKYCRAKFGDGRPKALFRPGRPLP